ncbi:MAG: 16S rRNA (guanine(966)-N(2))-methyltransferase RsmD [Acidimicrobiales bacterium]|jgi:16S rRNA (guanine966-N2)-methyltransferase|nr:16S rRNA (guanine(966)-N(2))-methyltransferase RsmD [Acidimicrobiales bacterium]
MRVVSGTVGGRRLVVPDGENTRPSGDRVRESVFNSLFSLGAIDGSRVLDAFAGSGALGIEALSRGAEHCTFVETDRAAIAALRENIETLGLDDEAAVTIGDGAGVVARLAGQVDLVLLDPPYAFDEWASLLEPIVDATVVIESDRSIELPAGWETHRERQYGSTVVTLAEAPSASA